MPLVNIPTLTPKKLAANRANAQLSNGPMTADGLIRVRDSNVKRGLCVQESAQVQPCSVRTRRNSIGSWNRCRRPGSPPTRLKSNW